MLRLKVKCLIEEEVYKDVCNEEEYKVHHSSQPVSWCHGNWSSSWRKESSELESLSGNGTGE